MYFLRLIKDRSSGSDDHGKLGVSEAETAAAQREIDDAQTRVTSAKRALDDADSAMDKAINDLARTESAYYANSGEIQQNFDGKQTGISAGISAAISAHRK